MVAGGIMVAMAKAASTAMTLLHWLVVQWCYWQKQPLKRRQCQSGWWDHGSIGDSSCYGDDNIMVACGITVEMAKAAAAAMTILW